MNTRLHFILLLICLFSFGKSAVGQLSLGMPTLTNVTTGDYIMVPFIAYSGFDSIESAQFVIAWDSTVLKYDTVLNFQLPQLSPSNFGYQPTFADILRFAWTAPNVDGKGVTLPPNTTLFSIRFLIKGPVNAGTSLSITEAPPTYFEIIKAGGTIFTLSNTTIQNGFVPVGYNVSASEPDAKFPEGINIYPNPANGSLFIETNTAFSGPIKLAITSPDGKIFTTFAENLTAGVPLRIDLNFIDRNTLLYLLIQTDQWSGSSPIVFTKE